LDLVVDVDGDGSRNAGDISPDHQYDPKFPKRMREA